MYYKNVPNTMLGFLIIQKFQNDTHIIFWQKILIIYVSSQFSEKLNLFSNLKTQKIYIYIYSFKTKYNYSVLT